MALRIGDMLVAAGFVTEDQVREALLEQRASGRRLGEELVALGFVTEVQLIQVLSNQLSVPWVSLHHTEMTRELLDLVPSEVADRYGLIPVYKRVVRREGETLFVAMDDPTNEDAIREVGRACGLPVKPMVAPPTDIRNAIRVYYLGMGPLPPEAPKRARRHTDELVAKASTEESLIEPVVEVVVEPVVVEPVVEPDPQPASQPDASEAKIAEAKPEESAKPRTTADANPTVETPLASSSTESAEKKPRATKGAEPTKPRTKQRFVTLTLLDGTTVRLPAQRKGADEAEPVRGGGLTGADLVRALLAKGQGAAVDDVLGGASWEVLCATILQLLLKKGLVADWEFVEAYKKNLGQ